MEEMLGNLEAVRDIYERWLKWEPGENAWDAYVQFEERNKSPVEKARAILKRFYTVFPSTESYVKAAKFEERHRQPD